MESKIRLLHSTDSTEDASGKDLVKAVRKMADGRLASANLRQSNGMALSTNWKKLQKVGDMHLKTSYAVRGKGDAEGLTDQYVEVTQKKA